MPVILITLGFEIVYSLGLPAHNGGCSFLDFPSGIINIYMHIYIFVYNSTFKSTIAKSSVYL